jgi:hypothetical protein
MRIHDGVLGGDVMPHSEFRNGYVAGWQSIRGREPTTVVPMFYVTDGETPYRAGIALGVRDALASIAKRASTDPSIDDWLDNALWRRWAMMPSEPTGTQKGVQY